jgi:hypothetical protein
LLGAVVDFRARLEPMRRRGREQILDQLTLSFGPETGASAFREHRDADLVVRSCANGKPRHPTGATAVIETEGEARGCSSPPPAPTGGASTSRYRRTLMDRTDRRLRVVLDVLEHCEQLHLLRGFECLEPGYGFLYAFGPTLTLRSATTLST